MDQGVLITDLKLVEKFLVRGMFAILAIFPFAVAILFASMILFGTWEWLLPGHGHAYYFLPFLEEPQIAFGVLTVACTFSLCVAIPFRMCGHGVGSRRRIVIFAALVFLLAVMLRLSFFLLLGQGMANTWDPSWAWLRACGRPLPPESWGDFFPWWVNYSVLMRSFVSVFGDRFDLFMALQCVWGGLGPVLVLLWARDVFRSDRIGLIAGLLYACYLEGIVYLTACANPEHVAIPFHLAAGWLATRNMVRTDSFRRQMGSWLLVAALVSVGDAFKPVWPIFALVVLTVLTVRFIWNGDIGRRDVLRIGLVALVLLASVRVCEELFARRVQAWTFAFSCSQSDAMPHNLGIGLDRQGEGQCWDAKAALRYWKMRKAGVSRDEASRIVWRDIWEDWRRNLRDIPSFMFKKTIWAWHDDCIAFHYLNYNRVRGRRLDSHTGKVMAIMMKYGPSVAQVHYLVLMVFGLVFCLRQLMRCERFDRPCILFLGLMIGAFSCLLLLNEASARYKCLIMPYVHMFAASVSAALADRINRRIRVSTDLVSD